MPVSAADIAEVRRMAAMLPDHNATDLSALETTEEVIGFVAAAARAEGEDEADLCEILVRVAELPPAAVRRAERVLRPLGYTAVANRLRKIAGRRKHTLAPLS
jgi:hypothetical protein